LRRTAISAPATSKAFAYSRSSFDPVRCRYARRSTITRRRHFEATRERARRRIDCPVVPAGWQGGQERAPARLQRRPPGRPAGRHCGSPLVAPEQSIHDRAHHAAAAAAAAAARSGAVMRRDGAGICASRPAGRTRHSDIRPPTTARNLPHPHLIISNKSVSNK